MTSDPASAVTPPGGSPEALESQPVLSSATAALASTTPEPHGDLLPRVLRNSFWLLNSSVAVRFLNMGRTVLLARLLLPEDFGLFGLANSVIGFTAIFGDVGIGTSLIYQKEMERRYQNTAFWMNFSVVSLLLAALMIASPMVSAVYGRPELRLVLIVLAAAFWMQVVGVVHRNLLRKQLRFGALAITEVLASAASFLVAVLMAWRGQGVWAFVCALVAANSVSFLSLWSFSRWTPRWEWSRGALQDIGVFSGWYLAATIVFYFAFSLDRLLVGKFLSVEKLGWYVLAYDLSLALIGALLMPVQQATVPELARLRESPAHFWEGYIRISRLTAAVASPLAFAAALAAPVILPFVFGQKWLPSILSFQVLVIFMLLRSVLADPFTAWGRFDLAFRVGLGMLLFGLGGILLGMRFGIVGVALAVATFMLAGQVIAIVVMGSTRELMHLCRRAAPFVAVAAGTCVLGWIVDRGLRSYLGFPSIVAIAIAVTIHLGFYAWIFRREITGVWLVFARRGEASNV